MTAPKRTGPVRTASEALARGGKRIGTRHSTAYLRIRTLVRGIALIAALGTVILTAGALGRATAQAERAVTLFVQAQVLHILDSADNSALSERIASDPFGTRGAVRLDGGAVILHYAYSPIASAFVVYLHETAHPGYRLAQAALTCSDTVTEISVDPKGIAVLQDATWPCRALIVAIDDGGDGLIATIALTDHDEPPAHPCPSGRCERLEADPADRLHTAHAIPSPPQAPDRGDAAMPVAMTTVAPCAKEQS